jgi:uncharacterized protein (TIGR02452 family)
MSAVKFSAKNVHSKNCIFYELSKDISSRFDEYNNWVSNSTQYFDSDKCKINTEKVSAKSTKYGVSSLDTISFVYKLKSTVHLKDKLGKVCILNMASDMKPGGGVEKGSTAQEEDICRRTDLYVALRPYYSPLWTFKLQEDRKIEYPLPQNRPVAIYTKDITIYKDMYGNDYSEFYSCDVVSMHAIRRPALLSNGEMSESDKLLTKRKIEYMLDVCLSNGCSTLVLGAFGCGAFKNNPQNVSDIFYSVFQDEKYRDKFSYVLFAVYDTHGNNANSNYSIFKKKFGVFNL